MNIKGTSCKESEGNNEQDIEHWRKGDCCYKVSKSLSESCSDFKQKVNLEQSELGYLVEEILPKVQKIGAWFLFCLWLMHREINCGMNC